MILRAEKYVIPLSRSMADKIDALRQWAKLRTIPATIEVEDKTTISIRRRVE